MMTEAQALDVVRHICVGLLNGYEQQTQQLNAQAQALSLSQAQAQAALEAVETPSGPLLSVREICELVNLTWAQHLELQEALTVLEARTDDPES